MYSPRDAPFQPNESTRKDGAPLGASAGRIVTAVSWIDSAQIALLQFGHDTTHPTLPYFWVPLVIGNSSSTKKKKTNMTVSGWDGGRSADRYQNGKKGAQLFLAETKGDSSVASGCGVGMSRLKVAR